MKFILLTLMVLADLYASAQDTARHRLVLSMSGGALVPRRPGNNVLASFAYTSTPVPTGVPTSRQFSGSLQGNYPPVAYAGDLLCVEVTSYHHAIDGSFGLFETRSSDDGGYLRAGYSRVLPFHRNRFRFQPGIDLYGVLGSHVELGRIDNRNQTLLVLGYTANPQWTETYSDRYGSYSTTYTADHLSVLYRRNALLIQPKVVLSTTVHRLVLGLQAGWMLQVVQGCRLLLQQQDNSGNMHTIGGLHEPHNGSLSGFYASCHIGLISRSRYLFKR